MKPILIPIAVLLSLVVFSSCLTSLHGLVDSRNVTQDNRITGNWRFGDQEVIIENVPGSRLFRDLTSATVNGETQKSGYDSREDSLLYSRSYFISYVKGDHRFNFVCCLTRINDGLYADLLPVNAEYLGKPGEPGATELFSSNNYQAAHSFAKLEFRGDELMFKMLDGNFIGRQLTQGNMALRFEQDQLFNTVVVTAEGDQIRSFLAKYGNDRRLYSQENTITLRKN